MVAEPSRQWEALDGRSEAKMGGSEGRGSEGRGSEGRGSEGRGSEGRGSEGRGSEGRGSSGGAKLFSLPPPPLYQDKHSGEDAANGSFDTDRFSDDDGDAGGGDGVRSCSRESTVPSSRGKGDGNGQGRSVRDGDGREASRPFSEAELAALVAAVELYPLAAGLDRNCRWRKIAAQVGGGRSKTDCFDAFKAYCALLKEQKERKKRQRDRSAAQPGGAPDAPGAGALGELVGAGLRPMAPGQGRAVGSPAGEGRLDPSRSDEVPTLGAADGRDSPPTSALSRLARRSPTGVRANVRRSEQFAPPPGHPAQSQRNSGPSEATALSSFDTLLEVMADDCGD
jgi:hypothetical protein